MTHRLTRIQPVRAGFPLRLLDLAIDVADVALELANALADGRADLGNSVGASVEVAVPLTGPRYDTGDETPKINLRVGKSF